jgi:hypothetical protein
MSVGTKPAVERYSVAFAELSIGAAKSVHFVTHEPLDQPRRAQEQASAVPIDSVSRYFLLNVLARPARAGHLPLNLTRPVSAMVVSRPSLEIASDCPFADMPSILDCRPASVEMRGSVVAHKGSRSEPVIYRRFGDLERR